MIVLISRLTRLGSIGCLDRWRERGLRNTASIFIGSGGLRAGWRFLLFVLGIELAEFYLRGPLLSVLSGRSGVNLDELSVPALFIEELVGLVSVLLVTGVAALLERRWVDGYGLPVAQAFGTLFWKRNAGGPAGWWSS